MNRLVIFDFNRTLFDPEAGSLMLGAREVLADAKAKGFKLVLLAQAAPSRRELIAELGIEDCFEEIILVEHKRSYMWREIGQRHKADIAQSYVVGDRAHGEVKLGHMAGWRTIWLQAGRFAQELPEGYSPTATVHSVTEVSAILT